MFGDEGKVKKCERRRGLKGLRLIEGKGKSSFALQQFPERRRHGVAAQSQPGEGGLITGYQFHPNVNFVRAALAPGTVSGVRGHWRGHRV